MRTSTPEKSSARVASARTASVLSPVDRFSEVTFGLIVALSVTGSVSLAGGGELERRTMLAAALGANVAWGIVDGVMYVLGNMLERGRFHATVRAVRCAPDATDGRRVLAAALPDALVSALTAAELEMIRRKVASVPDRYRSSFLTHDDLSGGVAVLSLVALSTFPVTLPFLFLGDVGLALRISNAMALLLLFGAGFALGRYAGFPPLRAGVTMVLLGAALVGVTISLGG